MRVPRFDRSIVIRLLPDLAGVAFDSESFDPSKRVPIRQRVFEFHCQVGPETAEYWERWEPSANMAFIQTYE